MDTLATTRMSSIGQVVIPESIRKQLNLKEGAQFVVVGEGDVVILIAITAPSLESFEVLIQKARQQAEIARLKHAEITDAGATG